MNNTLKEQDERRKKLIEEFFRSKNPEKLNELHSDISTAVALAIGPINPITAPFIISTLELYKRSVSKNFPEAVPMADQLLGNVEVREVICKMPFNAGGDKG